jgi:hypothetical protein
MIDTTKILTYAVIQDVYCVFGIGSTADDAYADAARWLESDDDGEPWTADRVENACDNAQFVGDLRLLCRDDDEDEFDSYLKNQGGFTLTDNGWVAE